MDSLPSLDIWLSEHMPEIKDIQAFTQQELSSDPSKLYEQLARASAEYSKIGLLLADIEWYLTEARNKSMLSLIGGSLNSIEKKINIEDKVKDIQRLHDQIQVICRALSNMQFASMNLRKVYLQDQNILDKPRSNIQ